MIRGLSLAACLLVLFALLKPLRAEACAGCSNPNLPTGRGGAAGLAPGTLSATVHLTGTTMNVVHSEHCPDIGPICDVRDEPPQLHDLRFYIGEVRPRLELGLTEAVGLEAQLPFRFTRTRVVFRRLSGEAFVPDYENIHHRNETLVGLADPWLLGRFSTSLEEVRLVARGGLTLPVGRTEEDPFARGRAGLPHQHIQYGTGTFNPVLEVSGALPVDVYELSAYAQTVLSLYENGNGYRAGNRYLGGVAVERGLGEKLRLSLGADVLNEQPERWQGVVQQDGNVGRTDILVGGALRYAFGEGTATLAFKAPVFHHFIEAGHSHGDELSQLTYPGILDLSFQQRFDLTGR